VVFDQKTANRKLRLMVLARFSTQPQIAVRLLNDDFTVSLEGMGEPRRP
jgi:hypothetical protein